MRLFNPWKDRSLLGRVGESIAEMDRVNQRMHNKALVVDNRAAILGGRNLGDEYFGLNATFNFHDLDVLGFGPVARQASAVFDRFWNSRWVVRVADLGTPVKPEDIRASRERLATWLSTLPPLQRIPLAPHDWSSELAAVAARLHPGTSRVETDVPADDGLRQEMVEVLYRAASAAERELLIVNAYVIPDERFIEGLSALKRRGVRTRMLTNSLASHDVPAVNSHYKQWRRPLIENIEALYEIRHDAAIQATIVDTPPTRAAFMGLHSKGMVIDRRSVFIGSMNFDPRSANINSEMGVFVESLALAEALARNIERDTSPANSWRVAIDASGTLTWTNDRETLRSQPARSWWQRVADVFFMAFPRSLY